MRSQGIAFWTESHSNICFGNNFVSLLGHYSNSVSLPPKEPFFAENERKGGSGMGWTAFHMKKQQLCKESQAEVLLRKAGLVCLFRAQGQSLRLSIFPLGQAFSNWGTRVQIHLRALEVCRGEESSSRVIAGANFSSFCVLPATSQRLSGNTDEAYDWHSGCWLENLFCHLLFLNNYLERSTNKF